MKGSVGVLVGLAWLALAAAALAVGGVELELQVDPAEVGLEDTLVAAVTVSGDAGGAGEPHLEVGAGFRVLGTSRSQSISFVNGRTSVELRYQYTLQPLREGVFEVGPALLDVGGRSVRSGKMRVRVVPGSVAPPPAPAADPWDQLFGGPRLGRRRAAPQAAQGKVRLIAQLDKELAYVNEQVTYTLKLLTQLEVRQVKPRSDPQLTGFWSETLEVPNPPQPEVVSFEGERYTYYLLRKVALFPTAPGRIEIPASVWDLAVVVPDVGFFGQIQELPRSTETILLEVVSPPEMGKPAGFGGAVGEFSLTASVDKTEVKVGEAVALKLVLSGTGNLKTAPAPVLPAIPDARSYSSSSAQNITMKGGRMSGSRTWEHVLVPNAPGEQTIPALRYDYFAPQSKSYRSAGTAPIVLRVSKADGPDPAIAAGPAGSGPAPAGTRKTVERVGRDVAHIKLEAPGLGHGRVPLHRRGLVRAALFLPVALNLAVLLYQWGRRRELQDPAVRRRRGAARAARARLSAAERALQQGRAAEVAPAVSEALLHFLADQVNEAASGFTRERVAELVAGRSGAERARALLALLDRCDYQAFASAGGDPEGPRKLLHDARSLLAALERAFARGPRR